MNFSGSIEPEFPPQGALPQEDGAVLFRTWAPDHKAVTLVLWSDGKETRLPMEPESAGYWISRWAGPTDGLRYAYRFAEDRLYPDPASRWQPEGVHKPSAFFDPRQYAWTDQDWRGVERRDLVIYELHVGTFTEAGTFDAIIPRLPELVELGVTAIELMPIAQFPGGRNWGYDGVHPYAAQNTYGGPEGLQRLVDAAHRAGLAVLLDVVYNHLGPEGNYLACFGPYFTDRYRTPWGKAVNYDGPGSDAVRQFVIDNARCWVRDFHLDGLRLDAVHAIYDFSPRHILADIHTAVQAEARRLKRIVHVIAETHQNDVRLLRPAEQGGYHLDGLWNDDFHHSVHALLTGQRDGYYQDFGRPEHLQKAFEKVFVYDGCYSPFWQCRHGAPAGDADRTQFVVCVQNHDQVGNRAQGDRFGTLLPPPAQRLAAGLLLISPFTPLIFMGEEYGEKRPFPFFCSFGDPALIEAVRRGRREEFAALAFRWGVEIPDPQAEATFRSAILSWECSNGHPLPLGEGRGEGRGENSDDKIGKHISLSAASPHPNPLRAPCSGRGEGMRSLYRDLLSARRHWPALRDAQHTRAGLISPAISEAGESSSPLLIVERGAERGILACANLGPAAPLLPPLPLAGRQLLLSTEEPCYGGKRRRDQPLDRLLPYELTIFGFAEGKA
jgi:maltooligosyltrehalose trehalohydrolase